MLVPDIYVVPNDDYWHAHPTRATLVIEIARSSARYDREDKAKLYAQAEAVLHRDRRDIGWPRS